MSNYFNKQQRFSIRKFSVGVASAVLGSFLIANAPQVSADEIAVQEPTVVVEEIVAEVNNNITEVEPAEVKPVNEVSVEVKTAEVAELPVVETSAVEAPAVETPVAEAPVVETRAATKRVATTRTAATRATTARTAVTRTTTPVTETATQEVAAATVANSGEQKETKVVIKDVSFSKLFGDAKEEKAESVQESATTNLELEFQKLLEQVHSGEIMPDTDLVAQDSFTKFNARENIPSSGTYRFKERLGIKSQPKVSSANIAYYNAGQTVNYDSVRNSDGKQWISYLSHAGGRYYIAVDNSTGSATKPATQPATSPTTSTSTTLTSPNARPQYQANTYPVGQCTWGAKQAANWVNNWWGDAGYSWINNAKAQGFTVGMTPSVGAVAVWQGHVAVVTQVVSNNQIRVTESNVSGKQYLADHRGLFNPNVTSNGAIIGYIYPPAK